jgi:cyanophycin synthetase
VAVLETARGGIVRSGLGYDWSDISVMTNIQADHIGQDGIESLDDIVRIKRLVAERVREGGTLILNADDDHLVRLPEQERVAALPKQIVYFSLDPDNPVIHRHVARGGTAYVSAGDWVEERTVGASTRVVRIASIPATLDGTAEFQIYNVLAAIAACRAYGMSSVDIEDALLEFRMEREGAGRVNIYALREGYVVVDYGHNPAALRAMCQMVSQWHASSTATVLAVPGDRSTALIEESARAAMCGFDRVIIREDKDLRGRQPGEVAEILARVVREERPERPVEIVLDELDAIATAVSGMKPNEVVVAFCDRVEEVTEWLLQQGAQPVTDFRRLTGLKATELSAA